jgi:hypothetical protein
MAKIDSTEQFKGRVGNILVYPYRNMMVLRTISGFTSDTLKTSPKYENCRKSANEFGRISALCKQLRVTLFGILPKHNKMTVVYSFTKKMRAVLEYDTINIKGERQLANALATENGKQQLKGYEFNPDTTIALDYVLTTDSLTVKPAAITYPKGIKHIGFRVHSLAFDFTTFESALVSGDLVIENETVTLDLPAMPDTAGVVFTILEAQFYDCINGDFVPMVEDGGKSVLIL